MKLLPLIPGVGAPRATRDLRAFLSEFLPPERWRLDDLAADGELNNLAARFAGNAFWPTGNNRAVMLLIFAFYVFFFTLLIPYFALAWTQGWLAIGGVLLGYGVAAWLVQSLLFFVLNRSLYWVDERLATVPASGVPTGPSPLKIGEKVAAGLFISYRRSDAAPYAGRLHDSLLKDFDAAKIFMDLADIETGADFVDTLDEALAEVSVMVALIGPTWASVTNDAGERRLLAEGDFVRAEVARGLARDILVVPVLVGGASMPAADDLPPDLAGLLRKNALEISDSRWAYDVGRLVEAARSALPGS